VLNAEKNFKVVLEADNGKVLLQKLTTVRVDLILLDLRMPVMDGQATIKNLKNLYPDIKVIILTGETETAFEREYIRLGAMAFLSKFQDMDTIINTIYRV
jgi:NarL family two-component system response regulator YdfI